MHTDFDTLGSCARHLADLRPAHDRPDLKQRILAACDQVLTDDRSQEPVPRQREPKLSMSAAQLHARLKPIDPLFTLAGADAWLSHERRLVLAAQALHHAGVMDQVAAEALRDLGAAMTKERLDFALPYFLTQGEGGSRTLDSLHVALSSHFRNRPASLRHMEHERQQTQRLFGRNWSRFPADPFALRSAVLPDYLDAVATVVACIRQRLLADTDLNAAARESLLDRFEQLHAAGRFQRVDILEPGYRFRPSRLPFSSDPATADAFYRTEQRIKELCLRLASFDCLDSRYGLAMVAGAEHFTDALIRYAGEMGDSVAPMDRAQLRHDLPRLINRDPALINRMVFIRALRAAVPPDQGLRLGARELFARITAFQQRHPTLESLLAAVDSPGPASH